MAVAENIYHISGGATLTAEWKGHGSVTKVGTGTLTFSSNNSGMFNFVLNGVLSFKKIIRNEFGTKVAPPSVDYTALWWNPEEPGWGMFVSHQSKNILRRCSPMMRQAIRYATWHPIVRFPAAAVLALCIKHRAARHQPCRGKALSH